MKATKLRDRPHGRIYTDWVRLPTWHALSPKARALLVEMLARFRPGDNGHLEWPVRRIAEVLGVSKSTAAECLIELERNGWLEVMTVAAFGGRPKPATYRLTMYNCDVSGDVATRAFEHLPGERLQKDRRRKGSTQSARSDKSVALPGRDGSMRGTLQSGHRDTRPINSKPVTTLDLIEIPDFL